MKEKSSSTLSSSSAVVQSRLLNLGIFGMHMQSTLSENIHLLDFKLRCDNTIVPITENVSSSEALVFINSNSYTGGIQLWENNNVSAPFLPSRIDDEILEVVTIKNAARLIGLQTHLFNGGDRLAQGKTFDFCFDRDMQFQVDGNALIFPPASYSISFHRKVTFLRKSNCEVKS